MIGKTKLFLILPLLILVIGFTSSVDGQIVEPITVSTDKFSYTDGEKIIVTGQVSENLGNYDVSLIVISPNGDVIGHDQMSVDNYNKFQTVLTAGGPLYDEAGSGTYTISVLYATQNRTDETTFQYISSNPEQDVSDFGALGSEHSHAGILVKIFGDEFDFSIPSYQIKSSWIHFESNDSTTIHKHATGVTLGYLFDTLGLGLTDQCYVFLDGRSFCTNEDYSLKFFINGKSVNGIRDYVISDGDQILISYDVDIGGELGIAPFVDPNQDPYYYVDRYNNEPSYKKWFDDNFPEYNSIYEAVGLKEPATQASITISTDKSTYFYGNYIEISGEINPFNDHQGVTMFVLSPEGKEVVSGITGKIYPYDKSYHFTIRAVGPHWENFGEYKIHVGWLGSSETVSIQFLAKPGPSPQCGSNEKLVGDRCVPLDVTPPEGSQIIDNDNDGVPDSKDKCLIHREDYNGYLDDDGCPDIPRKKAPFEKELLNGDEYVPIVYSIDFTKRPLIGISFGENKNEQFQKVIPSIKNGVEMWTTPLEQKYGGDWGVDFVIITPQNQLQVKPDIIFNIETLETNEKCSGYSAWAHQPREYDSVTKIYKAKIPLNIHDCFKLEYLEEPKYFELLSTTSFESTAAHEFFHSLGFDHICNKALDLMTGPDCTQQKPGGYTYEEFKKSKIVSDFDLTAIAYLYGVDGFQNPNKPVFRDSKFTANDYLNFDASTYTITPVSSPEPEMEKTMEPKILRPLQQIAMGISPQDVTCKDDFQKLYKLNGNPICVSKSSAKKLISRGWP